MSSKSEYQKVVQQIKRPLSDQDIKKIVPGINIVDYKHISPDWTLDRLLGPNNMTGLLYNTTPTVGHWVFLQRLSPTSIEYFDPYSFFIDDQKLVPQIEPVLSKLLLNSGIKKIVFNNRKLQSKTNGVNTCGRWVATRAFFRSIPLQKFIDMILHNKDTNLPDYWVYLMTSDV